MNAPNALPVDHMIDHKIEWLPVGAIAPSDTAMQKLRRERILRDQAALASLAESVKADGIWSPIVVRKLGALRDMATHELVAGERRWRAAQMAGHEHVPAIVRDLDDAQILRAQLTENIQRQTLHPLEEAEGYAELIERERTTVDGIAPVIGKSRSWIYDRLKLRQLIPEAREALLDGRLDPYLALPVARTTNKKLQAKAFAIAMKPGMSVRELKSRLTGPGFTAQLSDARFPIADATIVPQAGACATCPNRTGNGSEFDASEDDPDICTDVPCFEAKTQIHHQRLMDAARASGKAVLTGPSALARALKADVLIGHVDLDMGFDEADLDIAGFDEPEGRTWRHLLTSVLKEGEALEPVLIEDPRDHRLRELVPVDRVGRLLKRKGITLPTWLGAEPDEPNAVEPTKPGEQHRSVASASLALEQADAENKRREREEKELAHRRRVAAAIYAKWKGKFTRDDWETAAEQALQAGAGNMLANALFDGKLDLANVGERDLQALILLAPVAQDIVWAQQSPARLFALARRLRLDPAKYKAEPGEKKRSKAKASAAKPAKKARRK